MVFLMYNIIMEGEEADKKKLKEALNTYYKMKREYEEVNLKVRRKITKNPDLSWKEKRNEYRKLKPKCINCKRAGGTIFTNTYNPEENGRKIMALCGDRANPCPLNIVINLGETNNYANDSQLLEKEIISLKNRIIKEKNDLIFGYISSEDAVKSFEDLKDELNLVLSNYELTLENYLSVVDNKEKKDSIKQEQIAIYQDIETIKGFVNQYVRNDNTELVRDAIEVYLNQLAPKIEKLNALKFSYRGVIYDSDDDTHHFIQKQYLIDDIETNYSKHKVGVETFQTGTKDDKVKKTATKKPRTSKPKPTFIVESDDEGEEGEGEKEEEEIPVAIPQEVLNNTDELEKDIFGEDSSPENLGQPPPPPSEPFVLSNTPEDLGPPPPEPPKKDVKINDLGDLEEVHI
jgi:hypothetical protein